MWTQTCVPKPPCECALLSHTQGHFSVSLCFWAVGDGVVNLEETEDWKLQSILYFFTPELWNVFLCGRACV